jgi:hypothetical protein
MPPNAADGLVVSYIPLKASYSSNRPKSTTRIAIYSPHHVVPRFRGRARMQGTAVLRVINYSPVISINGTTRN